MSPLLFVIALLAALDSPAPDTRERQWQQDVAALAPAKSKLLQIVAQSDKAGQEGAKAKLHEGPLLRWSNPTAGSVYGEVYLWSIDNRPAAVASIYRWYHPYKDSTVEIVSLTSHLLEAREKDAVAWQSSTAGVVYKPLPKVPAVAASKGARLGQMRAIARSFSAELTDKRGGDDVRRKLRLLNQPVYRYESPKFGVVDGAMFALVEVTDPEVWLIVEAIHEDGAERWQYALARMNADALEIRLNDAIVESWQRVVDPWRNRKAPYTLFGFDPKLVPLEKPKEAAP
ncbi:MAG: hypothetical protein IAF94_24715 [Pirellulaceae bacterium]|nr:hypothetical protein [Pirellulaceae bacterium]